MRRGVRGVLTRSCSPRDKPAGDIPSIVAMGSIRSPLGLSLAICLLLACSGHTIDVGTNVTSSSSGTSFSAAQVQAAQAACNAAHGPADGYSTADGMQSHLVGAWFLCSANGGVAATSLSGAYSPSGAWNALVPDGSGGLVAGQGLQETGTYSVVQLDDASATCDPATCLVQYSGGDGALEQYSVAFETSPRRLLIGEQWWYVALDQ
jgi:hypothetical protein